MSAAHVSSDLSYLHRDADLPSQFDLLTQAEQAAVQQWLIERFEPAARKPRFVSTWSSYGIKHRFGSNGGFYLTNGAMKGALLHAGFVPVDAGKRNWKVFARERVPERHGFPEWLCRRKRLAEETPTGDLARDWDADRNAPRDGAHVGPFLRYLSPRACDAAVEAFCWAFLRFAKEEKHLSRFTLLRIAVHQQSVCRYDPDVEAEWVREPLAVEIRSLIEALPARKVGGLESGPVRPQLRFEILRRDNFTCKYCGRSSPDAVLQVDHVIPRARGGLTVASNLVTACRDCNLGKSDKLIAPEVLA